MAPTTIDRVTGLRSSAAIKAPVSVVAGVNIDLAGLQTIDGVVLQEGWRVLVNGQTDATENGIYNASSGEWTRAPDFSRNNDVVRGTRVWVNGGTLNQDTDWVLTVDFETFGVDDILFTKANDFQNAASMAAAINVATAGTPSAADKFVFWDDASGGLRSITWANYLAGLNALYLQLAGGTVAGALRLDGPFGVGRNGISAGGLYFNRNPDNPFLLMSAGDPAGVMTDIAQLRASLAGGYIGFATATASAWLLRAYTDQSRVELPFGRLQFPATANPSTDANTLDDYEEGLWTPTLTFGGGATGLTYGFQHGQYIKIGQFCLIEGRITLTAKGSSTGSAVIAGLPFTSKNHAAANPVSAGHGAFTTMANMASLTAPGMSVLENTSTMELRNYGATGSSDMTDASFTNTTAILFVAMYRTNT